MTDIKECIKNAEPGSIVTLTPAELNHLHDAEVIQKDKWAEIMNSLDVLHTKIIKLTDSILANQQIMIDKLEQLK